MAGDSPSCHKISIYCWLLAVVPRVIGLISWGAGNPTTLNIQSVAIGSPIGLFTSTALYSALEYTFNFSEIPNALLKT